ncbi:MAG: L-threonylcarbamoyladenylate synthase [Gammaproteobacteria bacterium]
MALEEAIKQLKAGGVIAYPTEAVYGLGSDPRNEEALKKILMLKKRSYEKGLIIIASSWPQLQDYVEPIPKDRLDLILKSWPGPYTWLFPVKSTVSPYLHGENTTIAVRVTAHPIARALCEAFQSPIVSTSANFEGQPPARNAEEVFKIFGQSIDYIVSGALGVLDKPTTICDALSGDIIRS